MRCGVQAVVILYMSLGPLLIERCQAERQQLLNGLTHLRSGTQQEWSSFPATAAGRELRVAFSASSNLAPQTLSLRRVDVKEGWQVRLNGQLLGSLFSDENDMREVWELPPGTLRDGKNELLIEATSDKPDDVSIGDIWLDPRPRSEVFHEATLDLLARDEQGQPLPCRFTILDADNSLAALGAESNDHLAVRSGVVYSSTGKATVGLAAGDYRVYCGRGFEYNLPHFDLHVKSGQQQTHTFELRRVVDTQGLVACDTHVHTFEVSRHGDASLAERMITLAGEGVELAVATDHNVFVDYQPYLDRLQVRQYITPIIGNEVTTAYGHFNVFPAELSAPLPNHQAENWDELFESIFATPQVRFAILNHPRDSHSGFTPFAAENMLAATGKRLDGRRLQANGIELINSAALQSDPMRVFHDWLTQVNRGLPLVAVGSSDSHEVSRKIVGQGRSYVEADDSQAGDIQIAEAVDSFVAGRVRVSLGLLTELVVNQTARSGDLCQAERGLRVHVKVQGPEWIRADRVELYANGVQIRQIEIPAAQQTAAGVKLQTTWDLEKPTHDIQLVALARGPGDLGLVWPIAKAYQPTDPHWQPYVFGSSGIVRVDSDGDGHWTSPRQAAQQLVQQAAGELDKLLHALQNFDAPTAAMAAEIWEENGGVLRDPTAAASIAATTGMVRQGFDNYLRSQRESFAGAAP